MNPEELIYSIIRLLNHNDPGDVMILLKAAAAASASVPYDKQNVALAVLSSCEPAAVGDADA
jgi:hypothetical protein